MIDTFVMFSVLPGRAAEFEQSIRYSLTRASFFETAYERSGDAISQRSQG